MTGLTCGHPDPRGLEPVFQMPGAACPASPSLITQAHTPRGAEVASFLLTIELVWLHCLPTWPAAPIFIRSQGGSVLQSVTPHSLVPYPCPSRPWLPHKPSQVPELGFVDIWSTEVLRTQFVLAPQLLHLLIQLWPWPWPISHTRHIKSSLTSKKTMEGAGDGGRLGSQT